MEPVRFSDEADNDGPAGQSDVAAAATDKKAEKSKHSRPRVPTPAADVLEDFILDSLSYKSMRDREEEVTAAHSKTLEWIFARSSPEGPFKHHFATWLASSSDSEFGLSRLGLTSSAKPDYFAALGPNSGPIFWISGKPGSGKSTLMRFLFSHPTTVECLRTWAGAGSTPSPVSKAGFFFWTSGSKEQRSLTGLLRYLLHQLLSEGRNRAVMRRTFPELWAKLQGMGTKERVGWVVDWDAKGLMRALQAFIEATTEQGQKVCLFVDGLDEFEGDHSEIVRFFRSLGSGPQRDAVKMCLSSRPWDVFEREFRTTVPHLRLQELTHQDMYRFVTDRLGADARVRECLGAGADLGVEHELFHDIVRRADGVFIWVRLTVNKILKDFQPTDGMDGLKLMIESLPTDLDALYAKLILTDRSASDIEKTATIFQLITAREAAASFVNDETQNSLDVWDLALAINSEDDDLVLDSNAVEVRQATDEETQTRCSGAIAGLENHFMGLVDAFPRTRNRCSDKDEDEDTSPAQLARDLAGFKVTYIHRTVRDWLMNGETTSEIGRLLTEYSPEGFDPHLRLLRSGVLALRMPIERPWKRRWLNDWWPGIVICMTHARSAAAEGGRRETVGEGMLPPLMRALDRTIAWYWLPRSGGADGADHWARHAFGSYEVRMKAPLIREPYSALVAKFGVERFIRDELERRAREESATFDSVGEEDRLGKVGEAVVGATHDVEGEDAEEEEEEEKDKEGQEEEEDDDGDDDDELEDTRKGTPLLSYATEFLCSRNKTVYPLSSPSFVRYLLDNPSPLNPGPNYEYTNFLPRIPTTPWIALLRHLRDAHRRGWIAHLDADPRGTARWAGIVGMFLDAGADADAVIEEDQFDPEITALGVLELLEAEYCDAQVSELRKKCAAARVTVVGENPTA